MKQAGTQNTDSPQSILDNYLKHEDALSLDLPDGAYLQLEKQFPFLLIFRQPSDGQELSTLIRGEASFLILPEGVSLSQEWQQAIGDMIERVSGESAGFLLLEVEVKKADNNLIQIDYFQPRAQKVATLLEDGFKQLKPLYLKLEVASHCDEEAKLEHNLLTNPDSATYIKTSLPDIFYHEGRDESYYDLLRSFRDQFSEILRQAIFRFTRVQTSYDISHAHLLARSTVDEAFWKADEQLHAIQKSFDFLVLLSSINMGEAFKQFEEDKYKTEPNFYYRLLPVDPEALKHQLYGIKVDNIHDSMLAFLIKDKREELGKQLDMLQERGSDEFLYSSLRLYKAVDEELLGVANQLLTTLPSRVEVIGYKDAQHFTDMAHKEFDLFKQQDPDFNSKIHLTDDTPGLMVSQGELYVPTTSRFRQTRVQPLIQHEVGTHVLTYYNGSCQPIRLLSLGLADYDELQEGLAVLAEYMTGGLDPLRMRLLAARVLVADMRVKNYSFAETFSCLVDEHRFTPRTAFGVVGRIYQSGGFTKDQVYLRGLINLWQYLKEGGDLPTLFLGKLGFQHIDIIRSLKDRGILEPARLKPYYWQHSEGQVRLNQFVEAESFLHIFS